MKLGREYERFRGGAAKPRWDRLHVTMNDGGVIYLNRNAHKQLGKPDAVYVYYCREKDEIALEATSIRMADAFPLRPVASHTGYIVYANPVTKHFGIKLEGTNRFVDPELDQYGIMHLKLSDIVQTARGPRRKKK
jgi:hypothetical protein